MWKNCKYAPVRESSKHCKKFNDGKVVGVKGHKGARRNRKGNFGCSLHCKFYEATE